MITAVDTNILLDVFCNDPYFSRSSGDALTVQIQKGKLVICDVVFAELASLFPSPEALEEKLTVLLYKLHSQNNNHLKAREILERYRKALLKADYTKEEAGGNRKR